MDKGPFHAVAGDITGKIRVDSDDFTHDASLIIYGDFANDDERIKYARFIAEELNSCSALREEVERLKEEMYSTEDVTDLKKAIVAGMDINKSLCAEVEKWKAYGVSEHNAAREAEQLLRETVARDNAHFNQLEARAEKAEEEVKRLREEVERLRAVNTTGQRNWCVTCEESGDKRKAHFTGTGMCPECYGRMVDKVEDLQADLARYREAVEWACDHNVMAHHHMLEECNGGVSDREWKYFTDELRRRAEGK